VETEIARYLTNGCHTFILDTAHQDDDYPTTAAVFAGAGRRTHPMTSTTGVPYPAS
jgi:hypothetical protein